MKVTLIAAVTIDGFIARDDVHLSTRWTSKEDTRFFRRLSAKVGHMVVGSKTFKTFDRKMAGRKIYVYSHKQTVENSSENDIEVVSASPKKFITDLESRGVAEVLICGGSSIYTLFMKAGVVDRLLLTQESTIFGAGVPLFSEPLKIKVSLDIIHNLSDQTKVFEYEVMK